jgi:hypothetical protein
MDTPNNQIETQGAEPSPADTTAKPTPRTNPNSAASAAGILQSFIDGDTLVKYKTDDADMRLADDRAVLIAAQLLSIATSLERIANALEVR